MTEKICSQGHVIDTGKELCSRCNSPAVDPETFIGEDTEILSREEAKEQGIDVEKVEEEAIEVEAPEEESAEENSEEAPADEVVEEEVSDEGEKSSDEDETPLG